MKSTLIAFLIICGMECTGQTWPSKDCNDKPYIKGNSDTIYHTGDCRFHPALSFDTLPHITFGNRYSGTSIPSYPSSSYTIVMTYYLKGKKVMGMEHPGGFIINGEAEFGQFEGKVFTYDRTKITAKYKP